MMNSSNNGVSTLESLTDTTIDSALGYEKAAELSESSQMQSQFSERASSRRELASQMNEEIARLGGSPREDGSFSGSAHRAFTEISSAFGDSEERIAERVEEGEDYILNKFSEALEDSDIEPQTRQVIQQGHSQIASDERFSDRLEMTMD